MVKYNYMLYVLRLSVWWWVKYSSVRLEWLCEWVGCWEWVFCVPVASCIPKESAGCCPSSAAFLVCQYIIIICSLYHHSIDYYYYYSLIKCAGGGPVCHLFCCGGISSMVINVIYSFV